MEIKNYNGQIIKISRGALPAHKKKLAPGELFYDYEENFLYIGLKDGELANEALLIGGFNNVLWQGVWHFDYLPKDPKPGGLYKITKTIIDTQKNINFKPNDFILYILSPEGEGYWYDISNAKGGGSGSSTILIDQDNIIMPETICEISDGTGNFLIDFEQANVTVSEIDEELDVKNATTFAMQKNIMRVRNY